MAVHDLTSQRLFVEAALADGRAVTLDDAQAHYLANVLRARQGAKVLVFNGVDGEWSATIEDVRKRTATLRILRQERIQVDGPDILYAFAPLKHARLDYMVQKATELGVAVLQPVMTERTIASRVNIERMRANAIEAAEQCGVLRVPAVAEPVSLDQLLDRWDAARTLIFCDEGGEPTGPIATLAGAPEGPVGVLIGPEGGFSSAERVRLIGKPYVHAISLGPRIMRADTAAVAALALVNAVRGDWR